MKYLILIITLVSYRVSMAKSLELQIKRQAAARPIPIVESAGVHWPEECLVNKKPVTLLFKKWSRNQRPRVKTFLAIRRLNFAGLIEVFLFQSHILESDPE